MDKALTKKDLVEFFNAKEAEFHKNEKLRKEKNDMIGNALLGIVLFLLGGLLAIKIVQSFSIAFPLLLNQLPTTMQYQTLIILFFMVVLAILFIAYKIMIAGGDIFAFAVQQYRNMKKVS